MLRTRDAAIDIGFLRGDFAPTEDYHPLLELFSEYKNRKLKLNGVDYTLFTKPAFVEYENGRVEEGIAYLLFGYPYECVFVSEICFARFKTAWEVFDMLVKARDCKSFYYRFSGQAYYRDAELNCRFPEFDVKTHLGVKHCMYYYDECITDDAVFFYGDDLFDGWDCFMEVDDCGWHEWHVFKNSDWSVFEDLGIAIIDRKDFDAGVADEINSEFVILEDYDERNELHHIAKTLPFRRQEFLDDYRYDEELGYDERVHPQTILYKVDE